VLLFALPLFRCPIRPPPPRILKCLLFYNRNRCLVFSWYRSLYGPHVCFWEEIMLLLSHPPHWQLVGLCSFNLFSAGIRICIFWFSQCSRTINFPFARDIGSYLSLIALISFVHICSHLFQFALIRSHVLSIVLFYFSFNYQILAYMQVWSDVRCRKRLLMLCAFLTTNALLSWRVNR